MATALENYVKEAGAKLNPAMTAYVANLQQVAAVAPEIAADVVNELDNQRRHLKLVASENYCSLSVQAAMGNLLTDKYAEGYPEHRYYGGCVNIDAVENTAAREAEKGAMQRDVIEKSLKKSFAPEFINRIDDIIYFNSLKREDIHRIIDIELRGLFSRVREMGYGVEMDEKAKDFLVAKGWDEQYGARPLRRAIQRYIDDDLADEIIRAVILPGDTIRISADENKITFDIEKGDTSNKLMEAVGESEMAVEM